MNALNELWQAEKKHRILVLCNENEIAGLQAQGVPVSCEDSLLSMQHLKMARLEAERRHKLNEGLQVFTITPEPVQATEAERALSVPARRKGQPLLRAAADEAAAAPSSRAGTFHHPCCFGFECF